MPLPEPRPRAVGRDGGDIGGRPAGLWAWTVPRPAEGRHADLAKLVVDRIFAGRSTMKGVSAQTVQKYETAASWLIEVLYQAFSTIPEAPAVLPRTPGHYSSNLPTSPTCGHAVSVGVLDTMIALDWVEEDRGFFDLGLGQGRITRIRAAGKLRSRFEEQGICWVPHEPTAMERLILISDKPNGVPRRFVDAVEDPEVHRWQDKLYRINKFLLDQCIRLEMPDHQLSPVGSAVAGDEHQESDHDAPAGINFGCVQMRRIFAHGSLSKGGRFYGGWWQHIPSALRGRLVINEDAVAEIDFSGMATACLYAQLGLDPGEGDMYDIGIGYAGADDPRRRIVKDYHNAKLNDAKGRHRPKKERLALLGLSLQKLNDRLQKRHPSIYPYYGSGVGLELQFVDSQIAEAVMLRFLEMGEVCLPVHDSFIVARRLRRTLKAVMLEEFERIVGGQCRTKLDPLRLDLFDAPLMDIKMPPGEFAIDALTRVLEGRSIVQNYYATWAEHHHDEYSARALDEHGCWTTEWLRGPSPDVLVERLEQLTRECGDQPELFSEQASMLLAGSHGALNTIFRADRR